MTPTGRQRPVRTRRTGDEVRARMLLAGRDVFAELGYAGATTKQIATRAEVGEVLLFRHFGNKAGVFEQAVLDPFEFFVDEWLMRWQRHGLSGESKDDLARSYIELLYGLLDDNRQLVLALLNARTHPTAAVRLQQLFSRLAENVREASDELGVPTDDPLTTVRLTFGIVLSTVEHADLLFSPDDRPTRDEIIDQLTRYMLYGVIRGA